MGLLKRASSDGAQEQANDDSQEQSQADDSNQDVEGSAQVAQDEGAEEGEQPQDSDDATGDEEGSQDAPDGSEDQDTGQAGSPADDTGGGPAAAQDLRSIPAKPKQQEEYNRANQALYQTLYQNQGAGNAVVKGIQPARKIDSTVRICTLLVDQLDKKLNLDQAIILPFTKDVCAHVMDIAEQVKQIQFSDDEANAVLGSTLQAVMHIFGVTKQQGHAFMQHLSPADQQQALSEYHGALSKAKAAVQAQQQPAQPQGQPDGAPQQSAPPAAPEQGEDESQEQEPDNEQAEGEEQQ